MKVGGEMEHIIQGSKLRLLMRGGQYYGWHARVAGSFHAFGHVFEDDTVGGRNVQRIG